MAWTAVNDGDVVVKKRKLDKDNSSTQIKIQKIDYGAFEEIFSATQLALSEPNTNFKDLVKQFQKLSAFHTEDSLLLQLNIFFALRTQYISISEAKEVILMLLHLLTRAPTAELWRELIVAAYKARQFQLVCFAYLQSFSLCGHLERAMVLCSMYCSSKYSSFSTLSYKAKNFLVKERPVLDVIETVSCYTELCKIAGMEDNEFVTYCQRKQLKETASVEFIVRLREIASFLKESEEIFSEEVIETQEEAEKEPVLKVQVKHRSCQALVDCIEEVFEALQAGVKEEVSIELLGLKEEEVEMELTQQLPSSSQKDKVPPPPQRRHSLVPERTSSRHKLLKRPPAEAVEQRMYKFVTSLDAIRAGKDIDTGKAHKEISAIDFESFLWKLRDEAGETFVVQEKESGYLNEKDVQSKPFQTMSLLSTDREMKRLPSRLTPVLLVQLLQILGSTFEPTILETTVLANIERLEKYFLFLSSLPIEILFEAVADEVKEHLEGKLVCLFKVFSICRQILFCLQSTQRDARKESKEWLELMKHSFRPLLSYFASILTKIKTFTLEKAKKRSKVAFAFLKAQTLQFAVALYKLLLKGKQNPRSNELLFRICDSLQGLESPLDLQTMISEALREYSSTLGSLSNEEKALVEKYLFVVEETVHNDWNRLSSFSTLVEKQNKTFSALSQEKSEAKVLAFLDYLENRYLVLDASSVQLTVAWQELFLLKSKERSGPLDIWSLCLKEIAGKKSFKVRRTKLFVVLLLLTDRLRTREGDNQVVLMEDVNNFEKGIVWQENATSPQEKIVKALLAVLHYLVEHISLLANNALPASSIEGICTFCLTTVLEKVVHGDSFPRGEVVFVYHFCLKTIKTISAGRMEKKGVTLLLTDFVNRVLASWLKTVDLSKKARYGKFSKGKHREGERIMALLLEIVKEDARESFSLNAKSYTQVFKILAVAAGISEAIALPRKMLLGAIIEFLIADKTSEGNAELAWHLLFNFPAQYCPPGALQATAQQFLKDSTDSSLRGFQVRAGLIQLLLFKATSEGILCPISIQKRALALSGETTLNNQLRYLLPLIEGQLFFGGRQGLSASMATLERFKQKEFSQEDRSFQPIEILSQDQPLPELMNSLKKQFHARLITYRYEKFLPNDIDKEQATRVPYLLGQIASNTTSEEKIRSLREEVGQNGWRVDSWFQLGLTYRDTEMANLGENQFSHERLLQLLNSSSGGRKAYSPYLLGCIDAWMKCVWIIEHDMEYAKEKGQERFALMDRVSFVESGEEGLLVRNMANSMHDIYVENSAAETKILYDVPAHLLKRNRPWSQLETGEEDIFIAECLELLANSTYSALASTAKGSDEYHSLHKLSLFCYESAVSIFRLEESPSFLPFPSEQKEVEHFVNESTCFVQIAKLKWKKWKHFPVSRSARLLALPGAVKEILLSLALSLRAANKVRTKSDFVYPRFEIEYQFVSLKSKVLVELKRQGVISSYPKILKLLLLDVESITEKQLETAFQATDKDVSVEEVVQHLVLHLQKLGQESYKSLYRLSFLLYELGFKEELPKTFCGFTPESILNRLASLLQKSSRNKDWNLLFEEEMKNTGVFITRPKTKAERKMLQYTLFYCDVCERFNKKEPLLKLSIDLTKALKKNKGVELPFCIFAVLRRLGKMLRGKSTPTSVTSCLTYATGVVEETSRGWSSFEEESRVLILLFELRMSSSSYFENVEGGEESLPKEVIRELKKAWDHWRRRLYALEFEELSMQNILESCLNLTAETVDAQLGSKEVKKILDLVQQRFQSLRFRERLSRTSFKFQRFHKALAKKSARKSFARTPMK